VSGPVFPCRIFKSLGLRRCVECVVIPALLLCSCGGQKQGHPFADITVDSFASMRKVKYEISERKIRSEINKLRQARNDTDYVDLLCNTYYAERRPLLWINRGGTDVRTDKALRWLDSARICGIPSKRLFIDKIEKALKRTRGGRFDKNNTINRTLAELEYYLTKGYMRYSKGQRYGYVDAKKMLNELDADDPQSGNKYRILCNTNYEKFKKSFFERAVENISPFRIDTFLANIQPKSSGYARLCKTLKQNNKLNAKQKNTLICNIERLRWRTPEIEKKTGFIEINLPSQRLSAINAKGESVEMKVCFGNIHTKTPLMDSRITHINLNPYWVIPTTIVRKEVAKHAHDTKFFERRHYEIIDRGSGEIISPEEVTEEMFMQGKYMVRQQRGQNNSLGRIIFRFPNEHDIYLHDTNEKWAFNRETRGVSHGCIRLEKPLELALLYLDNDDEELMQNLRYSIAHDPNDASNNNDKTKGRFINTILVKPNIPLSIVYYTCRPDKKTDKIIYYNDIYKYDAVLLKMIKRC